jgi:hypothetical protein
MQLFSTFLILHFLVFYIFFLFKYNAVISILMQDEQ